MTIDYNNLSKLVMNKTEEIINQMCERDQDIIRLRFHEEKSVPEIAKIMKMSDIALEDLITGILAGIRQRLILLSGEKIK